MKKFIIALFIASTAFAATIQHDLIVENDFTLSNIVAGSYLMLDGSQKAVAVPSQAVHTFFAGPNVGSGSPTFRLITTADLPAGLGTVTSVDLAVPTSILTVTGGPITTSGTITVGLATQPANSILAGPITGSDAAPTFRALDELDIPTLPTSRISSPSYQTFQGIRSTGFLDLIPGWSFEEPSGAASVYTNKDLAGINFTFNNFETAVEVTADGSNATAFNGDFHFDRNNTGFSGDQFYGMNVSTRAEGSGHLNHLVAGSFYASAGNGNGASVDTLEGGRFDASIATGSTIQDFRGFTTSMDGQNGTTTNNAYMIGAFHGGGVGANLDILSVNHSNGAVGGNVNILAGFYGNTSPVGGDFNGINIGGDSTVANNATGFHFFQSQDVARQWAGAVVSVNGNLGQDGDNHLGFDVNFGGGSTYNVRGSIFGFNLNNNDALISSGSRFNGLNINNGTGGTAGNFTGIGIFNQANMADEKSGINMSLQGNSRTATGLNISMQGAGVDDVQAIRVNVNGQTSTSTSNHVKALDIQGGQSSIFGDFKPFNGANVEIGNGYSITSTIDAGNPLTGTDQIIQLIQSNLLVSDDIATGPFGLDTNMIGAVSQVAVDTGKTVPILRSLLVGTSVPQGAGGNIPKHVVVEMIGLPSFGGAVSNPYRVGVEDGALLGQNFCDGATECWTLKSNDPNADVHFRKNLILGGTTGHGVADAKLVINEGHTKYVQATAPVGTPDANAGTGATCTVLGTDTKGNIELVSGSASWASGTQCSIAFDVAYDAAPDCIFSPANDNAAIATPSVYLPAASTTGFNINFVNPDTVSTTYKWSYRCD